MGGESGFDAAVAFRDFVAAASELDGESIKTNMTIHNTTPTITVSGFVRRRDRTGPMAALYCCGVLNSSFSRSYRFARAHSENSRLTCIEPLSYPWIRIIDCDLSSHGGGVCVVFRF